MEWLKNKISQLLLSVLLSIFLPIVTFGDDIGLQEIRKIVTNMSSDIKADQVLKSPVEGWYTIKRGAYIAYISEDGRHLIQGDMYNLETQINLSEGIRNDSRREAVSAYPLDSMIIFASDKKSHAVTIFTDVDCTFCRRLHSQIDDYLDAGIEVRYLLYPRNGPQSESWVIAEQIWCSNDRNKALTLAKIDQKFDSRDCDSSSISENYMLGQVVGLQGTPAIVLEDGTMVNGYVSATELSRIISSSN
jgi:thiol:disulfide interchange protein DsbC|tara:strand:+ start:22730 stop:23470 length:741 start_codon:yes stop_codon:yes gene_type:complete